MTSIDLIVVDSGQQPAVHVPHTTITRKAFQNRFPLTENGLSTKYDRMTLFLKSQGYAETLGYTGTDYYTVCELIITGINRLDAAGFVDLADPEVLVFLTALGLELIPAAFRVTPEEAATILNSPVDAKEIP